MRNKSVEWAKVEEEEEVEVWWMGREWWRR